MSGEPMALAAPLVGAPAWMYKVHSESNDAWVGAGDRLNRRIFFGTVTAVLVSSIAARAQSPAKKARVGVPIHTTPGSPTLAPNLNNNSWVNESPHTGGWTQTGASGQPQIYDMEFAQCYTHTSGAQLEFTTSNHSRLPGNNTGVRLAEFTALGAPVLTYAWPNNDALIYETDNLSTFYLSWKQWCIFQNHKIISIGGTPSAIKRWPDAASCAAAQSAGSPLEMSDVVDYVKQDPAWLDAVWRSVYNPACDQNPPANTDFTFNYGGGVWNSYPNGVPTLARIVDDNPNYPATSTKRLRMRIITAKVPSPTHMHHGVRIGNHFYWGGTNIHNAGDSTVVLDVLHKFYRLRLADLRNGVIAQEEITDCPIQSSSAFGTSRFAGGWKYGLLCADTQRMRIIFINGQGVFVYTVPANEGPNGTWSGPYTFGMTTAHWANTMSDGHGNLTGTFAGFIGSHRSDMNKTFFRYNRSKKWHRITWPN